ncbi:MULTISPECIES: hypothetical protein [Nosocomiicoccus]|uniref:Uncharacterized protein n=1 Tax=Nosocomiicoccus massiliensis TaxID=1232430 RepID=A0AAF0YK65_9STAP|nr:MULTISPECIES: hypothetical protein [Nosocomiicoccus]MDK6863287.1 hypothetical protein [Nosocomiicoccus ampullae]WOS96915.1 hypothetical protein CJ229_004200 [Nosocomiicoccus massiliensis]
MDLIKGLIGFLFKTLLVLTLFTGIGLVVAYFVVKKDVKEIQEFTERIRLEMEQ